MNLSYPFMCLLYCIPVCSADRASSGRVGLEEERRGREVGTVMPFPAATGQKQTYNVYVHCTGAVCLRCTGGHESPAP
jgi:hypothetical protein